MTSPLRCIDCPKSAVYPSKEELEAHIAAVHVKMFPYRCQLCKYGKLPTEYALTSHYSEVHGTANFTMSVTFSTTLRAQREELGERLKMSINASNSPGIRAPKMEIYTCENSGETACGQVNCLDCTKEFHSKEQLEAHIAEVHLNSMPYECDTCKHTMFPTEHILRCHHHEDHNSNQFNVIMQYSPEIAMEREELARRLELCLANSSKRSDDPAPSAQSMTTPVTSNSGQGTTDTEATVSADQPLVSQQPACSSVSSVRESPGKLPSSSGPELLAHGANTPVLTRSGSAASNLSSNNAIPQPEPQTSGTSTPVPPSRALTVPAEQSLGISTAATSSHAVSSVRSRPAVESTVTPVQQKGTSGNSNRVQPSRSVNRTIKRDAGRRSSGPSAKRAPGQLSTPQVNAGAPAASPSPRDGVKVEEPDCEVPAEQPTSSTSAHGLVRHVPFPLKVEEIEEAEDSEEVDDSDDQEEEEENVPEKSRKRQSCSGQNLTCSLCSITFKSDSAQLPHACFHGQFTLFECKICNKKFTGYRLKNVKNHMERKHDIKNGKAFLNNIKDHRKKMKAEMLKMKEKCFPRK